MGIRAKDDEREGRIAMEIIMDAYGAEEQAMSWYYYIWMKNFNFLSQPVACTLKPSRHCKREKRLSF